MNKNYRKEERSWGGCSMYQNKQAFKVLLFEVDKGIHDAEDTGCSGQGIGSGTPF